MNPLHLKTFLAAARHLNYTRAAKELFLSQPAVSRQIRLLEEELGIPLFEQIGKSLRLTDAGRTLAAEAEPLLGRIRRTVEAVAAHRSLEEGRLRIGASTTPGFYLLPRVLGKFHALHPGVELYYTVENSLAIEQKIIANEIDLGFVGARPAAGELKLEPVAGDEVVCFASASHPLAAKRRIDPKALEQETWVIREHGSATRRLFEAWLAKTGARRGRTIELHSPEAIKALVAAGVGFSFMSIHGLQGEIRRGELKRLPVTGLRLGRTISLLRHVDKRTSPVMEAFLKLQRKAF